MAKSINTLQGMLKKLGAFRDGRIVSNKDLFAALGRDIHNAKDGDYVTKQVSELKVAGYITVHHDLDIFPRRRTHVAFTDKGMDALEGRLDQAGEKAASGTKAPRKPNEHMSMQEITDVIKEWNRQNPSWYIDPKPKYLDEEVGIGQR